MTSPFRPQPGDPTTSRHAKLHCRACGYAVDAATVGVAHNTRRIPENGDYSICFRCGEVSVYAIGPLGVTLREPTDAELIEFARHPANTAKVRDVHRYWASKNGTT